MNTNEQESAHYQHRKNPKDENYNTTRDRGENNSIVSWFTRRWAGNDPEGPVRVSPGVYFFPVSWSGATRY